MQRAALINGTNKNKDHDLSKISEALMTAGVIEGLLVTSGSVAVGFAFIEVLRAGKKIRVMFESDAAVTIDTTGTKKVFVSIDQTKVDDGSSNAVDGTGIGSIQTAASYPASNFVPLASIASGVITDERSFIKPTAIEDRGTLLKNPILSSKSANYTLLATEKNNTVFSMDTSGGNRTFTLNPALFPTTNGCFVFTFTKSTSDANTLTIDVGSGNTIDGSQAYVLTVQNESVTIVIQSSTFAKVIGTSNKPIILATETFQKSIIAGEDITAGRMVRMGKITNIDIGVGNITQSNGAGSSTNFNISSTTAFCEIGQSFIANIGFLSGFSVWVKRLGSIGINWNLELFSDAGFTTLIATSTNSFTQSSLTTTSTEFVFNFANIPLVQGSTYYVKMNSSNPGGGVNASNYVIVEHSGTSLYSDGIAYSISSTGVVTSLSGNDLRFNVAYFLPEDTSKIYQTNSSIQGKIDYIGMSLTTTTSGNSCPILFAGCIPTTGLTVGREYYLNGTAGQVGVTPGTFGKLIGFSISATSLLLYENIKKEDSLLALRSSIAASGTVTYTHALGRVPTIIDVKSIIGGTSIPGKSLGTWLGNGSNACVYAGASGSGVIDTTFSIRLWDATSKGQTGVIQNVTATSFDIVWTYAATPSTYDFALIFILS